MKYLTSIQPEFQSKMRIALIVGLVGAAAGVAGLFISGPALFFQGYLIAFLFWAGISLGLLSLLLTHYIFGSHWGLTIRRIAEAGASSLILMAVLFVPLIFGLTYLYPWARPEEVAANHMLQAKTFYLNVPFFILRAVLYFAVWIFLSWSTNRWSERLGGLAVDQPGLRGKLQGQAAGKMILYFLTMTFAAIDWLMSLQPLWTSTAFGLVVIIGQALSAISFAVLVLNLFPSLGLGRQWKAGSTPVPYKDLGSFLLVFVMGWAYVSYFQMLIIWAGNIPREVVWYQARVEGGWSTVAIIIAVFMFALPFLMLLSGKVRHNLRILAGLGGMLLAVSLVNVFWYVKPAFFPGAFSISWLDLVLPVAVGGLWIAVFLFNLARRQALSLEEKTAIEPASGVKTTARLPQK